MSRRDDGLNNINRRAAKQQQAYLDSFTLDPMNPNNFSNRNNKIMFYCAIEAIHNTFFHFIETVKVRSQARNIVSGDISHYFKNQVEKKPMISGVISGFLGALSGAFVFATSFSYLTNVFYSNSFKDIGSFNRIKSWDFS